MTNKKIKRSLYLVILPLFIIAIAFLTAYFHYSKSVESSRKKSQIYVSANQYSKGENTNINKNASTEKVYIDCNFVSSHKATLSDKSTLSKTSVCTTTPGAKVIIFLSKNKEIIKLPEKTADSNGTVMWDGWSVKDYRITEGDWRISATSSLSGSSATAEDSNALEVSL